MSGPATEDAFALALADLEELKAEVRAEWQRVRRERREVFQLLAEHGDPELINAYADLLSDQLAGRQQPTFFH
jgi:hypothetical protein